MLITHEIPLFLLPEGWFLHVLLLHYCFSLLFTFSIVFTVEHNPMLGSHTGGLVGSLQPAAHDQLLTAIIIVKKVFKVSFCLFYC